MTEAKHYVGIEAVEPFDSVLGEIGRLQGELWNSHIRPERLVLSSGTYDRLVRELGGPGSRAKKSGGASAVRERPTTVYGLEIGQEPLVHREIRLEGVPFRQ